MKNAIIQRIEKEYVGEDCVQVMFIYDKELGILSGVDEDVKLKFYHNATDTQSEIRYTNEYVNDERRKQFPYYNIPMHTTRIKFKKYNVVNQLLDYDIIYQIIREVEGEACTMYCKALKDADSAIIIQATELNSIFGMTATELKHMAVKAPEPNIQRNLNKGLTAEEINSQKSLVRRKNTKYNKY